MSVGCSGFRCLVALVFAAILAGDHASFGQVSRRPVRRYQSSVNEPMVSPYLRLIQPGSNPGLNYFTLVQPQLQQLRTNEINAARIQGLRTDVQQAKAGAYGPVGGIRATGGGATYQNYSHFYPSLGGAGGGGGRPARNYPAPAGGAFGGGMGFY